jgi:hypothetical protein
MGRGSAFTKSIDFSQGGLALSSDYHIGFLSAIIPFGIWGLMAYVWFMVAGLWVIYQNWKHGHPALQTVNAVLFALCFVDLANFASLIGGYGISTGVGFWAGHVGLSIALNNGVGRGQSQATVTRPATQPIRTFPRLRPGFQR